MPDRTQEIKNLRAVAVASKNYTDKVADNLRWELGTYDLGVESDTDTAHIKTLPSGTIQTTVAKVEGVGYKVNQLIGNLKATFTTGGVTFTNNGDGSMTLNGTATEEIGSVSVGVDVTANITFPRRSHKVLVTCNNTLSGFYIGVSGYSINNSGAFFFNESNATDWTNGIGCHIVAGTVFNNFKIIPQVFDLTADFGSGNEPTSVSDCATAYLQRGINIYEYTPQQSSIKNNAFTGATVEGFNKWDEEWEEGSISSSTGQNASLSNAIRSKNYITALPNTSYYYCVGTGGYLTICYYDSNKQFISALYGYGRNQTYTTPNDCHYIRFACISGYGGTYKNDICINISGSANGTYVPYIAPTTISVDLTTIKDSNNVSLFPSGKMMGNSSVADFITPYNQESRYVEYTFTGNETWNKSSVADNNSYYCNIDSVVFAKTTATTSNVSTDATIPNLVHNKYSATSGSTLINNDVANVITIVNRTTSGIQIRFGAGLSNNLTPEQVAQLFANTTLQYERATYLTSTTDLTSLTKINAESNGTITLNNTDNVDMPNTVKSLKEVAK